MSIQTISKKAIPIVRISYLSKEKTSIPPLTKVYPVQNIPNNIAINKVHEKSRVFFNQKPTNLLSTIKEESGRDSSPSKSQKTLQSLEP